MARQGSAHHLAVLTEEIVVEMRRRYREENVSQEVLAIEYSIAFSTAYCAIQGKTWKHVRDFLPAAQKPRYAKKLTEDRVRKARCKYAAGVPVEDLAKEFGCDIRTIKDAIHRKSWKHVD